MEQYVSVHSPKLPVSNNPGAVFGGGKRFAKLIDFGQSIDMTKYHPGTTFMAKVNTKCFQCIEMKTNRPWTYQVYSADHHKMTHGMTKPTKWHVRPAKTQISLGIRPSDQSLRCPHVETLGSWLSLEHTAKALIRLGRCPGWSESSLGTQSFCHEMVLGMCDRVRHKPAAQLQKLASVCKFWM